MEKNTNLIAERLKKAIAILKGKMIIKTNQNIIDKMQVNKSNFSSAYNGNTNYLTEEFVKKFVETFPNHGFDFDSIWNGKEYISTKENLTHNPKVSYELEKGRPFYDIDWGLGFSELNDDTVFNPEFNIDFPPANKDGVEWYRGKGNSMLGEIDSGDYIALEEVKDFSWFPLGRIYGVITKNGFRTIKRVVKSDISDNYLLISSNPDKNNHPDQDIPKSMITRLFKIVFVIKDLDE